MAKAFVKANTVIAASTPTSVAELLAANGFTGSMVGKYLRLDCDVIADMTRGSDSSVDATTGIPMIAGQYFERIGRYPGALVDPASVWLFSSGGGTKLQITFESA